MIGNRVCTVFTTWVCTGENHIDHGVGERSFKAIVRRFETDVLDSSMTSNLCTAALRLKWQAFHRKLASLSLTCKACNLTNK